MILIRIERVDLSEWIECLVDLQTVAFVLCQQAQEFVMLRAQFKDDADADDDVLEVGIVEGLALPLVALVLTLPELFGELSDSVTPATADAHALVQFDTDLGERALPDVVFFEFFLDARSQGLRRHLEEVLHTSLWIGRVDLIITPHAIKAVLRVVY